ncbi:MAG: sporulation protein YabP [Clostridia bacterium]|nr:sporulation protein YabP [Clostridia bacterium]
MLQFDESQSNIVQNVILENRKKLTLTGIKDVLSFDDEIIVVESELGLINVKGNDLKVNKISVETGDVIIEGIIKMIEYSDKDILSKQSLISKIFK